MKLYNYKLTENLRNDNLLIIIIDLGDNDLIFNKVDIYIQDNEEIIHALKIIKGNDPKKLLEYLEEIYTSEIDPSYRGEK